MDTSSQLDLDEVVGRIADRKRRGRTEATVQSDIRLLLLASGLNLTESDVLDVDLESQVGDQRRIDIEMGRTVIEVKRDIRRGGVLGDAELQLAGYIDARTRSLGQRYVGLITDGASWRLFHHSGAGLVEVSAFEVDASKPTAGPLIAWLSSVLMTEELVAPTAAAITNRLGSTSPGHELERATLKLLFKANADDPEIQIKQELWSKLLTTALGTQFHADDTELFIEHTLLVATAECIAHAVLNYPISELPPSSLLGGDLFARQSQIHGVVEQDFFDWPLNCGEAGRRWVRALARRLEQFDWSLVEHDAMKTIYESVISVDTRRKLGEYYTPDFLAEAMVEETIQDPLTERVMDPSCGSGTFLFHAIRHYLAAADEAGMENGDAVDGVTANVSGMDLHPVAVTLARVTYLLAIGSSRLAAPDRRPIRIPVYLGDSIQWGQREDLFSSETLNVDTDDGAQLFADQLRFPQGLLGDADRFDTLVSELAELASDRERGSAVPSLGNVARRHGLSGEALTTVQSTFETMCRLHDERRNHIWGYYVRNLARPAWLSRAENRLDVLIGNPPWLAYRFMTVAMKEVFQVMASSRGLWSGQHVATHQDLSDLFVARAVEQFLDDDGRFSFVMPAGVLTRGQSEGFRLGSFRPKDGHPTSVQFGEAWDVSPISHRFFPRTACVITGEKSANASEMPKTVERWTGKLSDPRAPWSEVSPSIRRDRVDLSPVSGDVVDESPYRERFANGANLYPRVLVMVTEAEAPPLGAGFGRKAVQSDKGMYPKEPWKSLDDKSGVIEVEFLHEALLGESVMPYWQRPPLTAVVPLRNGKMMADSQIDDHEGLREWWYAARSLWSEHQKRSLTLDDNVDHYGKLSSQFPLAPIRVVYGASGMHVTACRVTSPMAVVEHQLSWTGCSTVEEAHFLCAVLNSVAVTVAVEPYMVSGKGGGRHISSYLWKVPIPIFDPQDPVHEQLAALGAKAEAFVADLDVPTLRAHGAMRSRIRKAMSTSEVGSSIESAVRELLRL